MFCLNTGRSDTQVEHILSVFRGHTPMIFSGVTALCKNRLGQFVRQFYCLQYLKCKVLENHDQT